MSRLLFHALLLALIAIAFPCHAQEPPAAMAPPAAATDPPPIVGQVEHVGFGLVGSRGRHYVFGGLAVADYSDSIGQRRIVTLQLEDQINDEKYLHYRELRHGHRWAFARNPAADGSYGVYFQLAATDPAARPAWLPFHRARLEQERSGTPTVAPGRNLTGPGPGLVPAIGLSMDGYCVGGL